MTETIGHDVLSPGEVHLWLVSDDAADEPGVAANWMALLDDEERRRYARYRFEKDRRLHLVAHALVRRVLSRYAPVRPAAWRFVPNAHGKPAIANLPADAPDLRFNLSHTPGLIACAITVGSEVGTDVERRRESLDIPAVARRFFSAREAADLMRLPPEERPGRFLAYWTLKEAYIKARGIGLSLGLGGFSFVLDSGDTPLALEADPAIDPRPGRWRFALIRVQPGCNAAVAVAEHKPDAQTRIVLHWNGKKALPTGKKTFLAYTPLTRIEQEPREI